MDIKEQLKDIKTQLRLSMNGVVSQSMREKGLNYKLNFGVELPRIKSIAAAYEKNHELAQTLWKEDIRECKILAGLLQPVETFFPEIADIWVENMPNIEIAELTCMNLFQHLPYAPAKSFHWIASEEEYAQICGFLTIARLLMKKGDMAERPAGEFLDQREEQGPVIIVETEFIDIQDIEGKVRHISCDRAVIFYLGKVAHSL